jgi:asparagine synthase (glutamine-hydrolysing)
MCGIFGAVGNQLPSRLEVMQCLKKIEHRGPDGFKISYSERCVFGFARLSILDLTEAGLQPFVDERSNTSVMVNGEIYNYQNLRLELVEQGYRFRSNSDCEVILWGFVAWGLEKLLKKIRGMFAIAISDDQNLYLLTDRYGKKPIFYRQMGENLIFASEIKSFFGIDNFDLLFSRSGVFDWMQFRGSPSNTTIYDNIHKVPPASYLKISKSTLKIDEIKYFENLDTFKTAGNQKDLNRQFEEVFMNAVEKRLNSEVPIALQLSGGIDSSLVAWGVSQFNLPMKTYSIGFSAPSEKGYSEEIYARKVADQFGLDHTQINMTADEMLTYLPDAVYAFDGMLDYPNSIPLMALAQSSKEFATVMLTGDGADEVFGGYSKFGAIAELHEGVAFPPSSRLASTLGKFLTTKFQQKMRIMHLKGEFAGDIPKTLRYANSFLMSTTLSSFANFQDKKEESINEDLKLGQALLLNDQSTYLKTMFERQDRVSSFYSQEARSPFVDEELIAFANQLPLHEKFTRNKNKIFLKKFAEKIFDSEFVYRKKKGFPMPLQSWLNGNNALRCALDKVMSGNSVLSDVFHPKALKALLNQKRFKFGLLNYADNQDQYFLWYLSILQLASEKMNVKGWAD